ncbi:hypothetical protein [Micromonospora sp. NPDC049645]|uniref:hypothetical protein n=1 Tax=Micromonospora sp. NPDC049645 TaxID=3155508 RepID=UPI003416B59D
MTVGAITIDGAGSDVSTLHWRISALTSRTARRVLRHVCADPRSGKMFVGGRPATPDEFWPADGSRPAAPYFAWGRQVQAVDRNVFESLVEALAPEFSRRGLPGGPVEVEVFTGDYRHTPGGIHRESCSNLHLVLNGTKAMHFWSGDWPPAGTSRRDEVAAGTDTPEQYLPDLDPADAVARARSLTQSAGGGFSWPAGTWHVAETTGEATAVNVAAYHRNLSGEDNLLPWDGPLHGPVPTDWFHQYWTHTGGQGTAAQTLARLSALGMRPAPVARRRRPVHRVQTRLSVPVLWTGTGTGTGDAVLLGALGAAIRLPAHTPLDWLAERPAPETRLVVPPGAEETAAWLCGQGVLEPVDTREEQ